MYSKYLFIGVCGATGGLIYRNIRNWLFEPHISGHFAYSNGTPMKSIFNYGMLMGLTLGTGIFYSEYSLKETKSLE